MRAGTLLILSTFGPVLAASPSSQPVSPAVARELLSGVCKSGARIGMCAPCPAFTSQQDIRSGVEGINPTAVIYGKFTDPNRTDALLDMFGCEAHAGNFGGSLLLRWRGKASWKQTRYLSGYRTGHCLKYPAQDGRELLLCQNDYYGMGTAVQSLILLDVRRAEPLTQILLSSYDTTDACLAGGSVQSLTSWKAVPGGRYPGLRITVKSATYTHNREEPGPDDSCAGTLKTIPSRVYTLNFRYDGTKFKLLPGSRPALSALRRDNPYLSDR